MLLYKLENLTKIYGDKNKIIALDNINLTFEEGEIIAILGPSGSGKSTLLNLMGAIDTPTAGRIIFNGETIDFSSSKMLNEIRKEKIGFIFQSYNLLPNLTVLEKVMFSTSILKMPPSFAKEALNSVGLLERADNFPFELSGGEQQRVSIARAIAKKPAVILADEPTGALDYATGQEIVKLLKSINERFRTSIFIITHSEEIAGSADKILRIKDGKVISFKN